MKSANHQAEKKHFAKRYSLVNLIGIPFGKQFFKIAKLSLMPFGATIS